MKSPGCRICSKPCQHQNVPEGEVQGVSLWTTASSGWARSFYTKGRQASPRDCLPKFLTQGAGQTGASSSASSSEAGRLSGEGRKLQGKKGEARPPPGGSVTHPPLSLNSIHWGVFSFQTTKEERNVNRTPGGTLSGHFPKRIRAATTYLMSSFQAKHFTFFIQPSKQPCSVGLVTFI